jgi:hypothetical protein
MRRPCAVVGAVVVVALGGASVAYGHPLNPPNGGSGDTPLNSEAP